MPNKKILTIDPIKKPNLRVGLRWDPREEDFHKFLMGSANPIQTIFTMIATRLAIVKGAPEEEIKSYEDKLNQQHKILTDNTPPHNLDLLCLCYDVNDQLVDYVSPVAGMELNENISIFSSGEDPDGVGVMDDEEIWVKLRDVPESVHNIFFAVDSEHHTFADISGDRCHIIDTSTEEEYFAHDIADTGLESECATFIFAQLTRSGDNWQLKEISEYLSLLVEKTKLPIDQVIDSAIQQHYF